MLRTRWKKLRVGISSTTLLSVLGPFCITRLRKLVRGNRGPTVSNANG